ncbi:MAG: hypothetical protein RIS17_1035 [Pseudomonadota bacterium]
MDFKGKVAVVLGASNANGIGGASAKAFAEAGAKVLIGARRGEELQVVADTIGADCMVCDAASEADIKAFADHARAKYGKIDFALNCAGLPTNGSISEATAENLSLPMDINFVSNVLFTRYMAEIMNDNGAITLISSTAVDRTMPPNFAYACGKAATECLARYAALEYGARGIRVNAIIPGFILTDLVLPMTEVPGIVEAFAREVPMGRCGYPKDISDVVMWLSAPNYITGVALPVSGGNQLTRLPRMDEMAVGSPV